MTVYPGNRYLQVDIVGPGGNIYSGHMPVPAPMVNGDTLIFMIPDHTVRVHIGITRVINWNEGDIFMESGTFGPITVQVTIKVRRAP